MTPLLLLLASAAAHSCAPVHVAVARGVPHMFDATLVQRTTRNFETAYAKACSAGFVTKPLAGREGRLFLSNAPNANAASIYVRKGRTLLEYPFVSESGQTAVPTLEQLYEAIYCAAHGASKKEQEDSGRCLPD